MACGCQKELQVFRKRLLHLQEELSKRPWGELTLEQKRFLFGDGIVINGVETWDEKMKRDGFDRWQMKTGIYFKQRDDKENKI
jgi:hypothetical protein